MQLLGRCACLFRPTLRAMATEAKKPKLSAAKTRAQRIIWIDCEMTGLEAETQCLVEIAAVVTEGDRDLTVVAESPSIIIHRSEEVLAHMNDWCKATFAKNGLTQLIRDSAVSCAEAEATILGLVQEHTDPGMCSLGGNSVGHDRVFLNKEMKRLAAHLHYRTVDVSSFKEIVRRWYPAAAAAAPKKKCSHRALDDIRESIAELKFYRDAVFVHK